MTTEDEIEAGRQIEGTYRRSAEAGRSIAETVLEAVAAASDRGLLVGDMHDTEDALDPLYWTIDPDALDTLLASTPDDEFPPIRVEFTYCGFRVTADSTGLVTVSDR